jgi:cell wall-associated NlpC family hydrolase
MISQHAAMFRKLILIVLTVIALPSCAVHAPVAAQDAPDLGTRAAAVALEQLGVPYRYGGRSPTGFDCSGLVQYAYGLAGKSLPRTTGELWETTASVKGGALRPGDLVFFQIDGKMSHVGLYLGKDNFVHAPSTGRVVSIESLDSPFYSNAFIRGGRPQ